MLRASFAVSSAAWCFLPACWFAVTAGKGLPKRSSVVVGNTRVQTLSPLLVRVEPKGDYGWEDRNTFMVQERHWKGIEARKVAGKHGETKIKTDHYTVLLHEGGSFTILGNDGAELYSSSADTNANKNLLHWPSPGTASGYAIVDSPRFHVPDWGAAPCPQGVKLPDYQQSSNGYDFGNDVDGDTYVFLLGKGIDGWNAARAEFARLTGPVPVLPDWAFGTWFTVWIQYYEEWAKREVTQWTTDEAPLDVWGLDVNWRVTQPDYMDQSYDHPNTSAFPDYQAWFGWLRERGVHTYFNDHPWQQGPQTSPEEVGFRWSGLTKWFEQGLSFWWFDHNWKFSIGPPNAPAADNHPTYWKGLSTTAWGSHVYYTVTDSFNRNKRPKDLFAGGRAIALSMDNPHNEVSGFTTSEPKLHPDSWAEPLDARALSESPAHHRYPVWWTGDYVTMNNNLEMMVDAGVHGFKPYVHADCGGDFWYNEYWRDILPVSLLRYAAMCSFGTILRFHGGEHQPWKCEGCESSVIKYITYRYKFMPMLIAAGYRAHRDGFPFVARVDLYWPEHDKSSLNHQYIFLDDILVAPIFGVENMSSADVWIPPGRWQNVWNGEVVTGPKNIQEWQPMERQPMWMRMDGGLLVMTDKPGLRVAEGNWSELTLEAYPCVGTCNTTRIIYERSLEIDAEPPTTTVSLVTNGTGVVAVRIAESTASLERAWTVRVHLGLGEEVAAATLDGKPVEVKTIGASPSDDGTPYHGFWPFGGKDAGPASKAGLVAQVSLEKSALAHTLLLSVAKPISGCSWTGDGCLTSTCCKVPGDECRAKNGSWAACRPDCKAGPKKDTDEEDAGEEPGWSCEVLGGRPRVFPAEPSASASSTGVSLYCFTVRMPKTLWHEELLKSQKANGYGIFACDASKVYLGVASKSGDAFLEVWREIQEGGQYKDHDWVVKVDIGTVFVPSLLIQHLMQLNPKANSALYIKDSANNSISRSLMVFSTAAMVRYFKGSSRQTCERHLGHHSEEAYFALCFDAIGVGHMSDDRLVRALAKGRPDVSECSQSEFAAFASFSRAGEWESCYRAARDAQANEVRFLYDGAADIFADAPHRPPAAPLWATALPGGLALGVAGALAAWVLRARCSSEQPRTVMMQRVPQSASVVPEGSDADVTG